MLCQVGQFASSKVRHEGGGARIQRSHIFGSWGGELDTAVEQVLRLRATRHSCSLVSGCREEIRQLAAVEFLLPRSAAREQVRSLRVESPMQNRYEIEALLG